MCSCTFNTPKLFAKWRIVLELLWEVPELSASLVGVSFIYLFIFNAKIISQVSQYIHPELPVSNSVISMVVLINCPGKRHPIAHSAMNSKLTLREEPGVHPEAIASN